MKIKAIKLFRFEATEEEVRAIARMFQYYEDTSDDDDDVSTAVRRAFGIKDERTRQSRLSLDEPDDDRQNERDETLPEKALRVSQGRRKSRITGNE